MNLEHFNRENKQNHLIQHGNHGVNSSTFVNEIEIIYVNRRLDFAKRISLNNE